MVRYHIMTLRNIVILIVAIIGLCPPETHAEKFEKFFKKQHKDGVEYIIDLFKESDIVILGERDHRESSQYEFIDSLLSNPWFIENVGHVYTEVGCVNHTPEVNKLIAEQNSDFAFRCLLLQYLPNEDYNPMWDKTNRSIFLTSLHRINNTLAKDNPIFLGLTDVPFSWDSIATPQQYRRFLHDCIEDSVAHYGKRDSIMAMNFMYMYQQQPVRNGHRKALLITNAPHALHCGGRVGDIVRSCGRHNQVKIVLMNWGNWVTNTLHAEGIPDKAFEALDCSPIGFDLKHTPFSKLKLWNWCKLGNVADGMIFDKGASEWVLEFGIDGLFDCNPGLEEELIRRGRICCEANGEKFDDEYWTPKRISDYYGKIHRCRNDYIEN